MCSGKWNNINEALRLERVPVHLLREGGIEALQGDNSYKMILEETLRSSEAPLTSMRSLDFLHKQHAGFGAM